MYRRRKFKLLQSCSWKALLTKKDPLQFSQNWKSTKESPHCHRRLWLRFLMHTNLLEFPWGEEFHALGAHDGNIFWRVSILLVWWHPRLHTSICLKAKKYTRWCLKPGATFMFALAIIAGLGSMWEHLRELNHCCLAHLTATFFRDKQGGDMLCYVLFVFMLVSDHNWLQLYWHRVERFPSVKIQKWFCGFQDTSRPPSTQLREFDFLRTVTLKLCKVPRYLLQ